MNKVETLIRERAKSNDNTLHTQICKQIVAFMETHPSYPFSFTISCACQKDAHKERAFLKGYKHFDGKKVETVYMMGKLYMAYNGHPNKKASDVVWRLMMRYYENVSSDIETFKETLATSKKLGRKCGSREVKYSYLCENLGMTFYDYVKDDGITIDEMKKAV